jgi:chemotaxis protein CheX
MVTTEIDPFVEATVDVLAMMADAEVEVVSTHEGVATELDNDYAGIMGLAGEEMSMAVTLAFPQETIVPIAASMLDETPEEALESAPGVIGELLNMISGQARAALTEEGIDLDMALPTVVKGDGLALISSNAAKSIVTEFRIVEGSFVLALCIDRKGG